MEADERQEIARDLAAGIAASYPKIRVYQAVEIVIELTSRSGGIPAGRESFTFPVVDISESDA